jgi:hypothetical protein
VCTAGLAVALLVTGIGIGSTIAPSMAAALQALSGPEIPRGNSVLNAVQRIAGAIGTAAFAILLQHFATIGGAAPIAAGARTPGADAALAPAFGATFCVAVALIATALVLPALLLPRPEAARRG